MQQLLLHLYRSIQYKYNRHAIGNSHARFISIAFPVLLSCISIACPVLLCCISIALLLHFHCIYIAFPLHFRLRFLVFLGSIRVCVISVSKSILHHHCISIALISHFCCIVCCIPLSLFALRVAVWLA